MKRSIFSLKSNTTAMEIIRTMAKTYVPRNFLMMYQSSSFRKPNEGNFTFSPMFQRGFLIICSIGV